MPFTYDSELENELDRVDFLQETVGYNYTTRLDWRKNQRNNFRDIHREEILSSILVMFDLEVALS